MKIRMSLASFWFTVIMFTGIITYMVYNENNIVMCLFYTILSTSMVCSALIININKTEFFSSNNIVNVFLGFVFILRPIQIMLNYDDLGSVYVIGLYQNIFGRLVDFSYPFAQASFIGMLGIASFNIAYFWNLKTALNNKLDTRSFNNLFASSFSLKQILGIFICLLPAFGTMFSLVVKKFTLQANVGLIDIAWIYIFSALIVFIIYKKKQATLIVYALIFLSMLFLSILAKRQYIVNLLLCYIIPLYYCGKKSKVNIFKIAIMCFVLIAVVLIYGEIRASLISATTGSAFEELMDEFCMYDMLVVSLQRISDLGQGLFLGYNFLTIFTTPISGQLIAQFDHALTYLVLNGTFNGGIPVTLIGSLYFNFSYIGVILGLMLLGKFFVYFQNAISNKLKAKKIMYYTFLVTFAYDIIRVGDIGREVWTFLIGLFVCSLFCWIVPDRDAKQCLRNE